jgi:DNA-binding XRE family transcriptional regulator
MRNLGLNIKKYRILFNISQVELANRISMDKQNLWTIEKRKSNPQILTLVKIASVLTIALPILLSFDFHFSTFPEKKQSTKRENINNNSTKLLSIKHIRTCVSI